MGDLRDDAEIVRDEEDAHAELALQPAEEVEDLRLDGHVEGGRRLVGDQELRIAGEREGDHDALAHAAGHLVRIVVEAPFRSRDLDEVQHPPRLPARLGAGGRLVEADHLDDLVAHREERVQARHRLLEDHRDLAPADVPHGAVRQVRDVEHAPVACPVEDAAPGDPARRGEEPHDRQARDRLARTRLADDRDGLAAPHREGHPVDRFRHAAPDVEIGAQVVDPEDDVGSELHHRAPIHPQCGQAPSPRAERRPGS